MLDKSSFGLQYSPIEMTNSLGDESTSSVRACICKCFQLVTIVIFHVLIVLYVFRPPSSFYQAKQGIKMTGQESKKCEHGTVYVYELPSMFNKELLQDCRYLNPWHPLCNAISNRGLGLKATGLSGIPENLSPAWYWTDMFMTEVIYHERIMNYKCRTTEPESATAFYIPFYAGLAAGIYFNSNGSTAKERDWHCEKLLEWIQDQPTWKRSNGSDHFLVLGRVSWSFRRLRDEDWGSSFLLMPLMKRVLRLSIERDFNDQLDVGVPYPTGFHPNSRKELDEWLNFVRSRNRTNLFTLAGAKRQVKDDFRTVLFERCQNESSSCQLVDCSRTRCSEGPEALQAFLESDFCLQPAGDSFTRKSVFDCMLAGSIPVFFWKESIEHQYDWFLGDEPERFSVFIDRKDVRNGTSIREVLEGYSGGEVERMREKVISLIPNFVYRNYILGGEVGDSFEDAFDLAIEGVLKKFKEAKMG